jgi:hypothetical protein
VTIGYRGGLVTAGVAGRRRVYVEACVRPSTRRGEVRPLDRLAAGRVAPQLQAHRYHREQAADQRAALPGHPATHRHGDQHVLAAGESGARHGECGQEHGERRGCGGPGELTDAVSQVGGQPPR